MSIAAYLKKRGRESRVLIEGGERDLIKAVKDFAPDLIGFPCLTGSHQWALSTAAKLKREIPTPNIFGGIHPTFFPEIITYPQVDMVCRGEGEETVSQVVERLEKAAPLDDIQGLWFKKDGEIIRKELRPLIADLNDLPLPDRDIYYRYKILANNPTKHFMSGRGCLFNCSFCYNSPQQKLYQSRGNLRLRKIEAVLEELAYVKRRYPLKTVVFDDDIFIINREGLFNFLDEYKRRIGLPFICNVRADLINGVIARALKKGGCFRVCMGVESGDEDFRCRILNKRIKDSQIMEAAGILKDEGIKILTNNMLGLPGENLAKALTTVNLNIKLKTDYPWCSILQPYPGTEIADYALQNGYLKKIDPDHFQPTFFEGSLLEQPDIKEVVNLQKFFYLAVKFPRLLPLIKRLVRFNYFAPAYNFIFLLTFAFRFMTANRYSFGDMFFISRDSLHLYLKRRIS